MGPGFRHRCRAFSCNSHRPQAQEPLQRPMNITGERVSSQKYYEFSTSQGERRCLTLQTALTAYNSNFLTLWPIATAVGASTMLPVSVPHLACVCHSAATSNDIKDA